MSLARLAGRVARGFALLATIAPALVAAPAGAQDPAPLRVNTFPTAKALPLHAGLAQGIFAKHGLKVELQFTENSNNQRAGLAAGSLEIAMAALDNAVAMIQVAKHDVVIVAGGDSGMNEFFVQPYINAFPDLRGRILVVDAPDTAYALLAKKILLGYGLKDGADYTVKAVGGGVLRLKALQEDKNNAAAVMNLPYSILAEQSGLKSLGRTVDMLGPYQANGMYVMRAWAAANGAALERYIAAYVEALRWALDPANKAAAIALLQEKLKLDRGVAERTYQLLADPSFGFTPDARLDLVGFRNMLALRGEIEGGPVPEPGKYLDLGYYERAVKTLAAKP